MMNQEQQVKLIITTKNITFEEHKTIIKLFNKKHGTTEKGNNYYNKAFWTNGGTVYNLNNHKKLLHYYKKGIKRRRLNGIKIYLNFIDVNEIYETTDTEISDTYEQHILNEPFNYSQHLKNNRGNIIHINNYTDYHNNYMSLPEIKDYEYSRLKYMLKVNKTANVGEVLIIKNTFNIPERFYEIVKITKKRYYLRQLKVNVLVKWNTEYEASNNYIIKLNKGEYTDIKQIYVPINGIDDALRFKDDYMIYMGALYDVNNPRFDSN